MLREVWLSTEPKWINRKHVTLVEPRATFNIADSVPGPAAVATYSSTGNEEFILLKLVFVI